MTSPANAYPIKRLVSWYLYDVAMASYSMVVVTAYFVVYFKHVVVGPGRHGDFLWGLAIAVTMVFVAAFSPILGAVADFAGKKRFFLVLFAGIAIASTYSLALVGPGMVVTGFVLFIVGYFGYTAAIPFYNGFLMEVAPREKWARTSGFGWGLGYLGAFASLLMILPFAKGGAAAAEKATEPASPAIFLITGTFFLLFAIPAFVMLRDHPPEEGRIGGNYLRVGFARLTKTFSTVREHRDLWRFFLAFFLFNDAITTVIVFFSVYARDTLHFSMAENVYLLLAVQITAALGAFASGGLTRLLGNRNAIALTLGIWVLAVMGAAFSETKAHFWIVSVVAGTVLGATQAAARTLVAELAPVEKKAEIFGFMAVCGKFAAIFGPLVFGAISSFSGSQRYAVLSVEFFFVSGLVMLLTVKHR